VTREISHSLTASWMFRSLNSAWQRGKQFVIARSMLLHGRVGPVPRIPRQALFVSFRGANTICIKALSAAPSTGRRDSSIL
jgi:hypothetical protein